MNSVADVMKAIEKTLSGMGGLIFLFLIISQFVAWLDFCQL
jgi:hypothetical protein